MDQNAQPLFAKPASDKAAGSKNNKGLIIGICCGAGVLLILIIVLILVLDDNHYNHKFSHPLFSATLP